MSRAHRRLIRERVAIAIHDRANLRDYLRQAELLELEDEASGEPLARCEICGAEEDGCGLWRQTCDLCGMPGCPECLTAGDDMYPTVCEECA